MGARFQVSEERNDKMALTTQVITDEKTGVQYLLVFNAIHGSTGITPLLDAKGKPLTQDN